MSNPTKQMAELLGTKNKAEQMERVQTLIDLVQKQGWSLTITVSNGRADFGVVGSPPPQDVLTALGLVRDTVVAQLSKQAQQPEPPEDDGLLAEEPLNDSEVPDNVMPEPPV